MTATIRGADLVARALDRAGLRTIFTLSGNHIMPVFDAALGTGLDLIHTRHEAAAVHMADAFARLTGQCGIALVTGGAGHTNAVAALCTAQAADSPLVLLSGHAGLRELGRGAFQELAQAEMAAPVTKASWTAASAATLAHDIARAVRIALSGRPGPVHVSLPVDLLEESLEDVPGLWPDAAAFAPAVQPLGAFAADAALAAMRAAARPLILAGPMLCHTPQLGLLDDLRGVLGVPVLAMESPRGINDPGLGAFAEVLARADLLVLLGKPHDFTIRFTEAPAVDPACRLVVLDPDPALIARAARERGERLVLGALADAAPAARELCARAGAPFGDAAWRHEVADAVAYRPPEWAGVASQRGVHPAAMCRAVAGVLERHPGAALICDGGEIGQWGQSLASARRRVINGVAGSIGAGVPFAIAARRADPSAPVVAIMGDGAFGFHVMEFDTALRCGLPMVVVVGNDACWNAEHQIQLRSYGAERTHGCTLLPTRYDAIVAALGGHGELVEREADLAPALERALASGKPACVNVMIEGLPAPVVRRPR
ncbi:thiamine pyrophosphate-binding protein [Salinarimonas soli]|uniref:Thiamine pyrophosphate-binding protein n=1 Tax=Salinarimonas soli TaxID=1638099 RepID=A0A5B2VIH1_9HYPH|nr:thiamine pyrophosphate-binding protein [Salinarimonas soli]KAA2238119.1 thiamine pyrophosphate-binding protein [Salinarimonas soli]